ncbi:MAG: short-chain dehydrogenase [Sulfobacillus thermosulfidooxidans]|uniref:Short-chain dehydrogenase n=1 Tax=Sulfobacillus thermotolerans TaxID=338644 RepID=A0ABM6RPU6_9FIRM|nr:SDR family NAD(P)-dependent oxidoreductase [Sulfobacillus sp. hq2]AUW93308.1 hypothetical protein BXT84_04520 [Sulfobacillus thermotolerans]MCY0907352.1 SDR family NAD(P)-dependent oxidoreductase [Sulfobacillus thermotolerans]POB11610.1 short-chain dehydrogenase [Sulfobacillus sp. hq2]PSR36486.1 MAG: short-chain dehydrogenase [Sulfobacillus thermosulfidooxidans]
MEQTNDRAIITGGSRGIGRAVAEQLVTRGHDVLLVARNAETLAQSTVALNALGPGKAWWFATDLTDQPTAAGEVVAYAERVMEGVPTLLLNGAGGASITGALDASWTLWQQDFSLKFWGYLAMMRAVLPKMMENRRGVIVNLVGVAGKDPNPTLAVASAVNGALRAVSKVLADEAKSAHVRVVNVNPGATDTDLLVEMARGIAARTHKDPAQVLAEMRQGAPLGSLPTAWDVASLIVFLMSDAAGFITGTSIDIDGGAHRGLA